jgi:hypothetical protein
MLRDARIIQFIKVLSAAIGGASASSAFYRSVLG